MRPFVKLASIYNKLNNIKDLEIFIYIIQTVKLIRIF
jgi:hypothetical protein